MSSTVRTVDTARDLGVVIDSGLSMTDQVSAICHAAYYQLRQLRTVTRCLTPEATKTTVQAFISCLLDYCNALLYGIEDELLRRLQSVQNVGPGPQPTTLDAVGNQWCSALLVVQAEEEEEEPCHLPWPKTFVTLMLTCSLFVVAGC